MTPTTPAPEEGAHDKTAHEVYDLPPDPGPPGPLISRFAGLRLVPRDDAESPMPKTLFTTVSLRRDHWEGVAEYLRIGPPIDDDHRELSATLETILSQNPNARAHSILLTEACAAIVYSLLEVVY